MHLTTIIIIALVFTVDAQDIDHQSAGDVNVQEDGQNHHQPTSDVEMQEDDEEYLHQSDDADVQQDITDVPIAVIKELVNAVFTACDKVKQLEGVTYEQLAGKNEPNVNDLTLKYYTRGKESTTYNINLAAQAITEEAHTYGPDEKLFIYIHGFTSSPIASDCGNVSEALFEKGVNHVMALDAGFLINWWYLRSTSYARFIGQKLGDVLAAMVNNGISASSIHIIGHSLGSHIASFTGKKFRQDTGLLAGRITGLDPAGPCFAQGDPEMRLQASDAEFVDVIHTNAGVMGIQEPVGHVDYYPNGGSAQPGCGLDPGCSHGRSWQLFSESILGEQAFPAIECDSWEDFKQGKCTNNISYMGFAVNHTVRGKFYLQTNGAMPYSLGEKGLKYEEKSIAQSISENIF